jgi:hypothetical protein
MDPNETLKRLRQAIKVYRAACANAEAAADGPSGDDEHDAANAVMAAGEEVCYLTEVLDEWITNGGFLPADWTALKHTP